MPVRYRISLSGLRLADSIHALSANTNFRYRPQAEHCIAHIGLSAPMSALPPKADMCGAARDVRYGPIAEMHVAFAQRKYR